MPDNRGLRRLLFETIDFLPPASVGQVSVLGTTWAPNFRWRSENFDPAGCWAPCYISIFIALLVAVPIGLCRDLACRNLRQQQRRAFCQTLLGILAGPSDHRLRSVCLMDGIGPFSGQRLWAWRRGTAGCRLDYGATSVSDGRLVRASC